MRNRLLTASLLLIALPALAGQLGYFHAVVEPLYSFTDFCVDEKAVYLLENFGDLTQITVVDLVKERIAKWAVKGTWEKCAAGGGRLYLLDFSGVLAVYDAESRSLIRKANLTPYPRFITVIGDRLIVGYPGVVEKRHAENLELADLIQAEYRDYFIFQNGLLIWADWGWILVGDEVVTINYTMVRRFPVKIGDFIYILTPDCTLVAYQGQRKIKETIPPEPCGVIETDGRYIYYVVYKVRYFNVFVYDKDLKLINNFTLLENGISLVFRRGDMKRGRFYQSGNYTLILTENWFKFSIFKVDVERIEPGSLTVCYATLLLKDASVTINDIPVQRGYRCLTFPRLLPGIYEIRATSHTFYGHRFHWRSEVSPGRETTVYIYHKNDLFLIAAISLAAFVIVYRLVEKTWPQFS